MKRAEREREILADNINALQLAEKQILAQQAVKFYSSASVRQLMRQRFLGLINQCDNAIAPVKYLFTLEGREFIVAVYYFLTQEYPDYSVYRVLLRAQQRSLNQRQLLGLIVKKAREKPRTKPFKIIKLYYFAFIKR